MVKQHRNQALPPSQKVTDNGRISSFWNTCGDNSQQYLGCSAGARPTCVHEYTDDDDDHDDSIIDPEHLRNQHQSVHRLPQHPLQGPHPVRSIVDGFMAPFLQCVQPPMQACLTHSDSWDTAMNGNVEHKVRARKSKQLYAAPDQPQYVVGNLPNGQNPTIVTGVGTNHTERMPIMSIGSVRISPNDVLCGRGNNDNNHTGNVRFRELIAANKDDYPTLTKKEKMIRAREIVDLILHHTDPPGCFVARDTETGLWHDIGMPRSLEKTSQALREQCASDHVVRRLASSDGHDTPDIEVTVTEQHGESNKPPLGRSTTINVNYHRNGKSLPPPIVVPDHLRNVYKKEPIRLDVRPTSLPPTYPIIPSQQMAHSNRQPSHTANPRFVVPSIPLYPPTRGPGPILRSDSTSRQVFPVPMTSMTASPKHPLIQQRSPTLPSVLVTPLGKKTNIEAASQFTAKPSDDQCKSPLAKWTEEPQYQSPIWNDEVKVDGPKSPIFPSDVFQNPNFDAEQRDSSNDTAFRWKELLPEAMSPSRTQSYPKRLRMSKNLLDISFDSALLDVDSSMESVDVATDIRNNVEVSITEASSGPAVTTTTRGGATTHRLVEAIGSQLTLQDDDDNDDDQNIKTLRSPSELVQTFTRGRNGRSKMEPLPRPFKATAPLDVSADSTDGLAALSTAAFLGLDESF